MTFTMNSKRQFGDHPGIGVQTPQDFPHSQSVFNFPDWLSPETLPDWPDMWDQLGGEELADP